MTSTRKNITQPADWWAAFEQQAKREGLSLSEWLGRAACDRLANAASRKLSDRPAAHRPATTSTK